MNVYLKVVILDIEIGRNNFIHFAILSDQKFSLIIITETIYIDVNFITVYQKRRKGQILEITWNGCLNIPKIVQSYTHEYEYIDVQFKMYCNYMYILK